MINVKTHSSVYLNVLNGLTDAAGGVEKTRAEQDEAIQHALKVVYTTRDMPSHPIAAHPRVKKEVYEKFRQSFLDLAATPIGKKWLEDVPMTDTVATSIDDYLVMRKWGLESYWVGDKKWLPMSLRFKLLIPLVLASLMALAYLHLDTVVEGLVRLMLTQQLDLVHENLDALRQNNPQWQFILLTNRDGKQLFPPRLGVATPEPSTKPSVQVLEKDIAAFGKVIGKLTVHVAYATRLAEIKAQQSRLTLLLEVTIVWLALTWLGTLEIAVVQPLKRLSEAAASLAIQRFDTVLPQRGSDEVGQLVGSFSAMREDIRTA